MKTGTWKRNKKNKWIIASVIALVIVLGGSGYFYYTRLRANTANGPAVETSTIGTGDIILSATGIGTLIPGADVSFGFKNSGQVKEVLASLGDQVRAGQVLARLDSDTLELKYMQAEANLAALSSPAAVAAAEQTVEEAKTNLATAKDSLLDLISPDLFIAQENLSAAQANLQTAKAAAGQDASDANKARLAIAEEVLAKAETQLAQAYNDYTGKYVLNMFTYPIRNDKGITTRREVIVPSDTEIGVAQAAYDLAKADLSAAQDYLDVLKSNRTMDQVPAGSVTAITEAKIAFDQAKANLDATELIAPISGTITSLNLKAGETVGTAAVVTISNLHQPYTLDVSLDETDWDKARVGFPANVTFDLLPDESFSAKVTQVYPMLDDSTGVSMVHVQVHLEADTGTDLPPGSSASVDITGGEALGVVRVPTSALKEVEPGKYVVYLMQYGTPIEQPVEIGLQDILYAEVKSGLQRGDVVLTNAPVDE